MTLWTDYLNRNSGNRVTTATEIARSLMASDPATFKRGYTADNALLAVEEMGDLTTAERNEVALNLAGAPSVKEIAAAWQEGTEPDPNPEDEWDA
jgi:hypothetical protein